MLRSEKKDAEKSQKCNPIEQMIKKNILIPFTCVFFPFANFCHGFDFFPLLQFHFIIFFHFFLSIFSFHKSHMTMRRHFPFVWLKKKLKVKKKSMPLFLNVTKLTQTTEIIKFSKNIQFSVFFFNCNDAICCIN